MGEDLKQRFAQKISRFKDSEKSLLELQSVIREGLFQVNEYLPAIPFCSAGEHLLLDRFSSSEQYACVRWLLSQGASIFLPCYKGEE